MAKATTPPKTLSWKQVKAAYRFARFLNRELGAMRYQQKDLLVVEDYRRLALAKCQKSYGPKVRAKVEEIMARKRTTIRHSLRLAEIR